MKIIQRKNYTTLILPKQCTSNISTEQHSEIVNLISASSHLLVNGIECAEINEIWIEIFILFKQRCESVQKKLRIVNFSKGIEDKLERASFTHKELYSPGIAEALGDFKLKENLEPNKNFMKTFIQTTPRVLYIQVQMLCKQKKISMKKVGLDVLPGDISGIIKVVNLDLYYAIILCFPADTFLKIMSHMLGENFTEMNKDIQDGAAELLNIIYGQVRTLIKLTESKIIASIPTVFVGNQLDSLEFEGRGSMPTVHGKMINIPFETRFGNFFIEAWFPGDFTGSFL
jgi:CheY-specific phosphatase CheX